MLPLRHRVARTGWATAVLGPFALHLGRLACLLGDFDAAEEDFRLSMERSAALVSPVFTAHTKYEWGRMLHLRARPADRPLADALLLAAREAASAVGMTRLERLADAELQ